MDDPNADASPAQTDATTDAPDLCVEPAAWWDASWTSRQELRFDNTAQNEDLSSFAVLVRLSATEIDYTQTRDLGQDLRFVDGDGMVLAHEIERWDESGESLVWVKVLRIDRLSAVDSIWLYYGNSAALDAQSKAAVWDADYRGVWHLAEASGAHVDSARAISCAWQPGGTGAQNVAGMVGGAIRLDGIMDSASCGNDRIVDPIGSTITAWVNLPLTGDPDQEIVAVESGTSPYRGLGLYVRKSDGAIGKWLGSGYHYAALAANRVVANTWTFIAIRSVQAMSGGIIEVSRNGGPWESVVSGNTKDLSIPSGTPLVLGRWTGPGPSASTKGSIDEVRVSGVARSDAWVRAQYLSTGNTFVTVGGAQRRCP